VSRENKHKIIGLRKFDPRCTNGLKMVNQFRVSEREETFMAFEISRRRFVASTAAGAAALSLGWPGRGAAQEFPGGNIKVTIPTGEGGGADRDSRAIAAIWQKYLERNFEFGYYPGAGGQVGYEFFMKEEPNAQNLLFSNIGPEVIMLTLQDVGIEVGKDLTYFKKTSTEPMSVWVGSNSPFKSLEDLIEEGKKRTVTVSVSRLPHPASIGMLALGDATGASFNLVPFGGGNPSAMAAITGEVDCCALPLANPITLGDQAVILGIFSDANPVPDATGNAPTVNEAAGTSLPPLTSSRAWAVHTAALEQYPDRIQILKDTLQKTLEDPEYVAQVEKAGVPKEFIDPGDQEAAMAEAQATFELATKFRDLLTGK
jgi:tripartite-type tricarboxylate transporter receptor subunit TctC